MKFNSIINDVCCDVRIKDGIFRLDNEEHAFILQEYLEKAGYSVEEIVDKTSRLFEAGRFPERQAYNKDGILVTFPNKEYRDRAVDKGTHFAENPKKSDTSLFAPTDVGGLATADIKTTEPDKEKDDSVSLDKELTKKISGDEKVDDRTSTEKSQDAVAVQSILTGETPLVNYSVDEAVKYGFYKKGFDWYDPDGNLIGEQIYDENTKQLKIVSEREKGKSVKLIKKKKEQENECNAIKMEHWIHDEFHNIDSKNSIAKKITQSLKEKGVVTTEKYGDKLCPITNPVFKTIKQTSKTDLILTYQDGVKKASLKNENSSLCQAQNEELNAVITTILKLNNEEQKIIDTVSSFIIDGLNKNFYTQMEDSVKNKFQSTLSEVIKLSKTQKLTQNDLESKVKDIKDIISDNKKYIEKGCFDVDVDKILMVLNNLFTDENKRIMFMREMITGEHRWGGDKKCIADHLMCWDCSGQQIIYPVEEFIRDNLYKINFRFRNRGGQRGICLRSDTSSTVNESLNEEIQKLNEIFNINFKVILDVIKNLGGYIKDFFISLYEYILNGLKEIKVLLLQFKSYLKNLAQKGWESFVHELGFEAESEGSWVYKAPTNESLEEVSEEPSLIKINPTNKTISFEDYDSLEEVFIDESYIKENNLFDVVIEKENPDEKDVDVIKTKVKSDNTEIEILRNLGLERFTDEEILNNLNQNVSLVTLSQGTNNKYGLTGPINYKGLESILNKEKSLIITYAGNTKKIRTNNNIRIAQWNSAKSIKSDDFKKAIMVYNFYMNHKDKITLVAKQARGLGYEKKQVQHLNEWFTQHTTQPLRLYISDETRQFRDTGVSVNGADKIPGSGKADLVLTENKTSKFWISYKHGHYWTETGSELSPVPFQQYGSIKTLNQRLSNAVEKTKWSQIMVDFLGKLTGELNEPKIIEKGNKFSITKQNKISTNQKGFSLTPEEKNLILMSSSTLNKIFTRPSNEGLTKKIYFLPRKFNAWMDLLDGSAESRQIAGMSIYGLDFKLNSTNYGPENVQCLIQTNEPLDVKLRVDEEDQPVGVEISTDKRGHILFNPNLPAPEGAENPILQYRPVINARFTEELNFVYALQSEIIILLGCRLLVMPYGIIPGTSISL